MLQTFLVTLTTLKSLQAIADLVAQKLIAALELHFLFLDLDFLVVKDEDLVEVHLLTWLDHIVVNIRINSMQRRKTITSLLMKALTIQNWVFLRLFLAFEERDFTLFNIWNL